MQNFFNYIPSIVEQGAFYAAVGEGANPLIDARDIADVAAAVLSDPLPHAGETLALTGGVPFTYAEAASILSEVLGREVSYVPVASDDVRNALEKMSTPEWLIDDLILLAELQRADQLEAVSPTVETLLGRPPRTFAEFASDHAERFGG